MKERCSWKWCFKKRKRNYSLWSRWERYRNR